jgi:hypothetical protein
MVYDPLGDFGVTGFANENLMSANIVPREVAF